MNISHKHSIYNSPVLSSEMNINSEIYTKRKLGHSFGQKHRKNKNTSINDNGTSKLRIGDLQLSKDLKLEFNLLIGPILHSPMCS